jgi:Flp pilus assembly protein TadG
MRRRTLRSERGSGLIGLMGGLAVFLIMLFTAVQITYHLHSRSMFTDAGYRSAREVAAYRTETSRADQAAVTGALLRSRLEAMGATDISIDWGDLGDLDTVHLHLIASARALLPRSAREALGLGAIDRTIVIRVERPR